ncbi:glycosyltransferase family 39 protein [Mucilaginibacter sp.]|uniref:ArnT family glycosyltransferase n=1 Tax=Mucilaginibacter sp. TaxID=1882438 RepID=UPI002851E8F9|nr:glycosyltransferase family 39 protein [Mucilaginibacter sp.]MDR3697881.1 glycosyltransferase family 39 protein [Mucilaginibacter sp.]
MMKKLTRNPWFIFLPFLFFYVYLVILNKWPTLYGDEIRYVDFAHNLIHGYYSPSPPHINLWNGPGYPLILVPFIALHVPVLYVTLLNAVYLYLAVVFLYKALLLITSHKIAVIAALLLALYPNDQAVLPILYTEAFTSLLVSLLTYLIMLVYINEKPKYIILAGFVLGYITLTKIIFGYVLVICLAACLIMLLIKKSRGEYLKPIKILLIALVVTLPYLVYTYSLTGKAFYWGDSGGMSLYWMSTPYDHEYGDWKVPNLTNNQYPILFKSSEAVDLLKKNHAKEIGAILKHNEFEQDVLFKQKAIDNIKQHPFKFLKNYYYNFSRMLFNFPYSYSYQDGAIVENIVIGSLILWASVAGIVLTWLNRRSIIPPVKFMLLITMVYLALSGALSSYPRQLDVVVPVLLFWMGYLIANIKSANLKFSAQKTLADIDLMEMAGVEVNGENTI